MTVEGGVAVKLRGAPDHPYSQGELCPKVNRFLDRVYAPDRVLTPLVRTGAKGAGEFRSASWDEALAIVVERVHGVIARYGGEAILPWASAGTQGLIQSSALDRRFFAALGASRQGGSLCGATANAGTSVTYGSGHAADPADVEHAQVVLLWATNTRLTNRHLWPFVERARRRGATVVAIDPVRTITAESSDWHVQPRPGTDVALMLAIMHVLIRDGLVDRDYVAAHARGFDELTAHVREWTPARAAEVCGVGAADIERLARLYGSTKHAFIRTLIGAEHREHGAMFFRTLACLPVLTGAWTVRGGGLARSVGVWNARHIDANPFDPPESPSTRIISMNHLGRALTDPAMGIHALFVWGGNPAVSVPNAGAVRAGLARDDLFTVVAEQFVTDTAKFADVIFPAAMQIEQFDVVPSWGSLYLGWNEPAIEPLGDAVPNTELWRRLACAFGIDDPLFALDDLGLIALALRDRDIDELRAKGWLRHDLPDPLLPYRDGGFATADGKAQLRADGLDAIGQPVLPHHTAPHGDYTLQLMSVKRHTRFLNSSYSQHHDRLERGPFIELSPTDAAAREIRDGQRVAVYNARARLELTAQVTEHVQPGLAIVAWGWAGADANVNALTSDTLTDWGGGVAFFDTFVDVVAV